MTLYAGNNSRNNLGGNGRRTKGRENGKLEELEEQSNNTT